MGNPKPEVTLIGGTTVVGSVAISKGDVFKFFFKANISEIVGTNTVNGNTYNTLKATDGQDLGLMHLLRNRNGLSLSGTTRDEKFSSLNDLFKEVGEADKDNHGFELSVRVTKVVTRTAVYDGEERTTTNYVFEQVN